MKRGPPEGKPSTSKDVTRRVAEQVIASGGFEAAWFQILAPHEAAHEVARCRGSTVFRAPASSCILSGGMECPRAQTDFLSGDAALPEEQGLPANSPVLWPLHMIFSGWCLLRPWLSGSHRILDLWSSFARRFWSPSCWSCWP